MVGNDASIAEDWFCAIPAIRKPSLFLETQHRSKFTHRPQHSTMPFLGGAACVEALSEGEGDGVLDN